MPIWDFDSISSRRWKRYDKLFSRKRFIIVIILVCLLLFYLIPLLFHSLFPVKKPSKEDLTIQCIENFLRDFHSEIEESDSSIWISPFLNHRPPTVVTPTAYSATSESINELTKNTFLPFIGNGKLSISPVAELESERRFHILGKRVLDEPIPFDPIVNIDEFGTHSKSAIITRYRTGTVEKCTCVNYAGGVISLRETFTAHRLIPSLFTQDIRVSNPTDAPLILRLTRKGWLSKPSASVKVQKLLVSTSDHREYSVIVGQVYDKSDNNKHYVSSNSLSQAVAIAYPALHDSIEIQARNQGSLCVQTFVNYTKPYTSDSDVQAAIPDLKVTLREAVKNVIELSPVVLQKEHESAWRSLWWSGFSITHSHAPNAVNGYQINATLYYLLSQRTMPMPIEFDGVKHERPLAQLNSLADQDVNHSQALLYKPNHCYNGHSTFHASRLWERLDSLADLQNVISLWYLTLEKHSCELLLQSGAKGVMQAAILSLSGLHFNTKHLELNSNPSDLQRAFTTRRLYFGNDTMLNLSVLITLQNKAIMQVSLDHKAKNRDFYACDAGCLDAPVRLTSSVSDFPVKLTDPLTSLLYITSDREHVRELKHSIHVKEIGEAPAHEHHTIALHRYGHSLGGLPTFFWVLIVILIVVFHLFLGKLIYNEYFATNNVPYERLNRTPGRYSM